MSDGDTSSISISGGALVWWCYLVAAECMRKPYLATKFFRSLRQHGVAFSLQKVNRHIRSIEKIQRSMPHGFELAKAARAKQQTQRFSRDIRISILTPLYNTPGIFLQEMIGSVLSQTYRNWELCLADGSDGKHGHVQSICLRYAAHDPRIKYKKLERNEGLAGNTNRCIEMAGGEYVALLDHDDILHPSALFEVMNAICGEGADLIYSDEAIFDKRPSDAHLVHFKPDYAPDTLRANNYICHLSVFSRRLLDRAGRYDSEYDGSQDYDMILRLTEKAAHIVHIPRILYYWRAHSASTASDTAAKPYAVSAGKKALQSHLDRTGLEGLVEDMRGLTFYRIIYALRASPLISILIPNRDHAGELKTCVSSILSKSTYANFEIIIIENNSSEQATFAYYSEVERLERVRVITWHGGFNYSAINNFGAKQAKGDILLLLDNDIEVITPQWLEEMLMFAQRPDVGAVGAKLYYPDNTVQHAGIILGFGGPAGRPYRYFPGEHIGYYGRLLIAQNMSAVTGACLMLRKDLFDGIGGLDEGFAVAYNDVDFCLRIRQKGYLIVFTPHAELYHHESLSRGEDDTPEKKNIFLQEERLFHAKWAVLLKKGDPYYNPNLALDQEDYSYGRTMNIPAPPDEEKKLLFRPWLEKIDLKKRILEIGPLTRPCIQKKDGAHVFYADIRSTEEVKDFYKNDPNISIDEIVEIDYIIGHGTYAECFKDIEKFEYIVASHVLEHIPQLVAFFQDIPNIMQHQGRLCLVVPDKRYCFDHFRCPTSFAECYDIYSRGIKNSPLRIFDHIISATTNDTSYWWGNNNFFDKIPHVPERVKSAKEHYLRALEGAYLDVHFSVFTPETFLLLLYNMLNSDLLPFKCIEFYPTEYSANEFNCVLELSPALLADGFERERENNNLLRLLCITSASERQRVRDADGYGQISLELAAIKNSRAYRLAEALGRIVACVLPAGSTRRKFAESFLGQFFR